MPERSRPPIVVMGVSGSGKTTIGVRLAAHFDTRFVDADDLHPAANVAKMRAGNPLTDADREPWLDAVGAVIAAADAEGEAIVVACSALRRAYRDRLRRASPEIFFVMLEADPAILRARVAEREHQYMPATLLASQLATLEPLGADEHGTAVDVEASPSDIARIAERAIVDAAQSL